MILLKGLRESVKLKAYQLNNFFKKVVLCPKNTADRLKSSRTRDVINKSNGQTNMEDIKSFL